MFEILIFLLVALCIIRYKELLTIGLFVAILIITESILTSALVSLIVYALLVVIDNLSNHEGKTK